MNSKDLAVLRKMAQHTKSILTYCRNCTSRAEFEADPMRVEATVFNLMQLGELAKASLSEDAKAQLQAIPWQQIYGLRNRIVHGYSGVNMQIVWDTVAEDIPQLHKEFELYLREDQTDRSTVIRKE